MAWDQPIRLGAIETRTTEEFRVSGSLAAGSDRQPLNQINDKGNAGLPAQTEEKTK
jgi:hypothetical protein